MQDLFGPILDDNEEIIKIFKPNKIKFFFSSVLWSVFISLGLGVIVLASMFEAFSESSNAYVQNKMPVIIFACFVIVFVLISFLFSCLYFKNLFYAYSNKRIIIRSGFFGIDFKSLDMSMIGAFNVNVSILDKMLRKNTGFIKFGSMASPMNTSSMQYSFKHIEKPYEVYKEIKRAIHENKAN